jgi:phosphoribosyl 1,2-cyclic phosphodiesterase
VRYGGNTSCAVVQHGDERLILDGGTGLRVLGLDLIGHSTRPPAHSPTRPLDADLLLTHTHWDHIQGLPYFRPLYDPGSRVRLHGPRQTSGLRDILERQMTWEMFPIPPSAQTGIESITELEAGQFAVSGWNVGAFGLCHGGHTLGYRLQRDGAESLAWVTDNELAGSAHGKGPGWRGGLVDFLQGVHTLVHDTTWSDRTLEQVAGWGHSSPAQAVELARDACVKRLVLFHHHPEFDDDAMDRHLAGAQATARTMAPDLEVRAAIEGETILLERSS